MVTDQRSFDDDGFLRHIDQCIQGGVDVVQYRDKKKTPEQFLHMAQRLKALTDRYDVPLVINDRLDVAALIKPDGVHVGRNDPSPVEIRETLVGEGVIVGYSITSRDAPHYRCPPETDYAGVGPIFATKTKKDAEPPMGLDGLRDACKRCDLPVIAIGGITSANARQVIEAGAMGVAIIGELMDAVNPRQTATELKAIISASARKWSSL